ncbi:MAG: polysaccharide deacetylase family protein [Hyphomicrobiaceae bacterium]|nr:polysaccharide deacetylase family protein [Hyphomicrobiaceae bacterium]
MATAERDSPYALMFHHFTDDRHIAGQGAITADRFERILQAVGRDRILSPRDWMERVATGSLEPHHTCLTFDDALRCQTDVALPVMSRLGLKAFWFVYSSVLEGKIERLEVYRYFRTACFDSVDAFYDGFEDCLRDGPYAGKVASALESFDADSYLAEFRFYTRGDRRFRYLRDKVLGPDAYFDVMDDMVRRANLDVETLKPLLWMDPDDVVALHADGHVVGLHSTSHPTAIADMPLEQQLAEYAHNSEHLTRLIGERPTTVAHPCGSYSAATLAILRDLGVTLGFRSNRSPVVGRSALKLPREDHANLP